MVAPEKRRERKRLWQREYSRRNRTLLCQKTHDYYLQHQEQKRAYDRAYRAAHPEKVLPRMYQRLSTRQGRFHANKCRCERCREKVDFNILVWHHLDRNRRNNQMDNLILVCPNCHATIHYYTGTGCWSQVKRMPHDNSSVEAA